MDGDAGVVCGLALQSLRLSTEEQEIMLSQVSKLAGADKIKLQHFDRFKDWVGRNGPFDVILDGANIGFSNQRVDKGATLQWSQIERVVRHFQNGGLTHTIPPQRRCKPLIILHERHFYKQHHLNRNDAEIIGRWRAEGILYSTPKQMNDDWFWLHAGVSATITNPNSIIISNDQMRDHHFNMLSMKYFLKWRERHWVNFEFFDRSWNTLPTFKFPSPFSVRVQPIGDAWALPLNDLPEMTTLEGGRPADGNPTGQWLCLLNSSD